MSNVKKGRGQFISGIVLLTIGVVMLMGGFIWGVILIAFGIFVSLNAT